MKRLLLLAAGSLLAICPARAAESIHIFLKGKATGDIKGDLSDNSIEGLAYQHEIVSPRDAASGLATGRRQHKPLTIVKSLDKATPLLYKMLATNETGDVSLKFWRKDPKTGQTAHYYTIELKNATISNIRDWKPNTRDLSADRAGDLEEVSFTYERITWTYVEGGVSFEDSWAASAN
jgi:type VI secretion system secreted protein Hcp